MSKQEKWQAIPHAEGFEVSNMGRCRSIDTGKPRIIKPTVERKGTNQPRLRCMLNRQAKHGWAKNVYLQREVAKAFCNIHDGRVVFKDGDYTNCAASNLCSSWKENPKNIAAAQQFTTPLGKRLAAFIAGDDSALDSDLKHWAPGFIGRLGWQLNVSHAVAEEAVWGGFFTAMRRARLGYINSERNIPAYFFIACRNEMKQIRRKESHYVSEWIMTAVGELSQLDRLVLMGAPAL